MRTLQLLLATTLFGFASNALAELGGRVDQLPEEQVQMKATLRAAAVPSGVPYTVHELTTASEVTIREYADRSGTVFAVTWIGPVKPDLHQLLGAYFQPYLDASTAAKTPGTGPQAVRQDDLVVISAGHPGALFGRAWVPSLVPTGVTIDALP